MWKVSNSYITENEMSVILVDADDEEHWIEVDKVRFQVLDDMGLIKD